MVECKAEDREIGPSCDAREPRKMAEDVRKEERLSRVKVGG